MADIDDGEVNRMLDRVAIQGLKKRNRAMQRGLDTFARVQIEWLKPEELTRYRDDVALAIWGLLTTEAVVLRLCGDDPRKVAALVLAGAKEAAKHERSAGAEG